MAIKEISNPAHFFMDPNIKITCRIETKMN